MVLLAEVVGRHLVESHGELREVVKEVAVLRPGVDLPQDLRVWDDAGGEGRVLRKVGRSDVDLFRLDAEELFDGVDVDGAEELGPLAVEEGQLLLVAVDDEAFDGVQVVGAAEPSAWNIENRLNKLVRIHHYCQLVVNLLATYSRCHRLLLCHW